MTKITNILVPFDDNIRSIRALEYAAMFATSIGAKITALHIADPKDYHSKEEFDKDLLGLVENQLRPKLAEIRRNYTDIRKIDLQIRALEYSIPQHIIDFALEKQIDFIVMRSHGLSQAHDWELHFKSTNAYKVLLDAPCPVFTFTQAPDTPKMKNIVLPLDLSEGSLFKVPFAITLAEQFKAKLHLVTALEYKEDQVELCRQMDEIFSKVTASGIDVEKGEVFDGTLPEAIFSHCEQHAIDLIIIMSRPGFRWSDLWVSPKAKRIVSVSKVPVVSLRAEKPFDAGL
jgi:nucleotide-binding universal stress UspA family protein